MDRQKFIDDIFGLIDGLFAVNVNSIVQYKDDFFKRVKSAYDTGLITDPKRPITGDVLLDEIQSHWMPSEVTKLETKKDLLREIRIMWDEWTYALEKVGYRAESGQKK